jgi:hypothetical protein
MALCIVSSRSLCGLLNGNIGKHIPPSVIPVPHNLNKIGVTKSVIGELTDSTNRAQAFALMPMVWASGTTIGYDT